MALEEELEAVVVAEAALVVDPKQVAESMVVLEEV